MASRTLYPPLVNSYEPAFIAAGLNSKLKVYYSLSSLSSSVDKSKLTVHAQIYRQDGVRVVNTTNDIANDRYRATGLILNLKPSLVEGQDNLYYIEIENSDLKSIVNFNGNTSMGWIPGWVYKIQLRLSQEHYDPAQYAKQEDWLQAFSNSFSEWSTVCYAKAISPMSIQIPIFKYNSSDPSTYKPSYVVSDMNLSGTIVSENIEANEDYEYVRLSLYDETDTLIEDSGEIYKCEQSNTYFEYKFKTAFYRDYWYRLYLTYKTENGYIPSKPYEFKFKVANLVIEPDNIEVVTIDADPDKKLTNLSSLDNEEEEGRIALKLVDSQAEVHSGNWCIRRSSYDTNYQVWEDIKIVTLRNEYIDDLDIIYDYTIESGVWYKYGVQKIDEMGNRGPLNVIDKPIQRLFNNSYLLGQGGKQLKLQYNTTISNFKHQIYDSKTDTIGSKYPFISRNAEVNYRTFPVSTLVSFHMDENNTFLSIKNHDDNSNEIVLDGETYLLSKKNGGVEEFTLGGDTFLPNGKSEVYDSKTVAAEYDAYNLDKDNKQPNSVGGRSFYDYTYERDFRKLVLDFLQDGKPKLFKSPTEGNIIVRLVDVSCTPNQTLDRLIYSVSFTANEIDDSTMEKYLKYGFYDPGAYSTDFSVNMVSIGQIEGNFKSTDNIFEKIYDKYDSKGKSYGGRRRTLEEIKYLKITINGFNIRDSVTGVTTFVPGQHTKVTNNGNIVTIGTNMVVSYIGNINQKITIYDPRGIYEFDPLLVFRYKSHDSLYLSADDVESVNATIDFIYTMNDDVYKAREIADQESKESIGQFFDHVVPGTNLFKLITYQHRIESKERFRRLKSISALEIEADPHTVFSIQDTADSEPQLIEVNDTGILRIYDIVDGYTTSTILGLKYIGRRHLTKDYDDSTLSSEIDTSMDTGEADVSILYDYTALEGLYVVEE